MEAGPNTELRAFGLCFLARKPVGRGGFDFVVRWSRLRRDLRSRRLPVAAVLQRKLFRRRGGEARIHGQERFRLLDNDAAKFLGGWQIVEAFNPEVFEKTIGGAVGNG